MNTGVAAFYLPDTVSRNLQILTCLNEWVLWNLGERDSLPKKMRGVINGFKRESWNTVTYITFLPI